jgi:hypothetical protein
MQDTSYVYIGGAIVVILVILLIIQNYKGAVISHKHPNTFTILVETDSGLIRRDNQTVANELVEIKRDIGSKRSTNLCGKNRKLINEAIANLGKFIKQNPSNVDMLCSSELKADIVQQALTDANTPFSNVRKNKYDTILSEDVADYTTDPVEQMNYLLSHLDITIRLLRSEVCDTGVIDLVKLRKILLTLNDAVCKYGASNAREETAYESNPHMLKPYSSTHFDSSIHTWDMPEPISSFEMNARSAPKGLAFGSMGSAIYRAANPAHQDSPGTYNELMGQIESGNKIVCDKETDANDYIRDFIVEDRKSLRDQPNAFNKVLMPDDEIVASNSLTADVNLRDALNGDVRAMLNCPDEGCDNSDDGYMSYLKKISSPY